MGKKLTRKKQRNAKNWKQSINKDLTNKGLEHVSKTGKIIPAKNVNFLKFCNSCAYSCLVNFHKDEIISIHDLYYSLSRKDKLGFILNYTSVITSKSKKNQRTKFYRYNFYKPDTLLIRVCKKFFLNTLCISQKVVYNCHSSMNPLSLTPPDEKRGKNTTSHIKADDKQYAIDHISSFPAVESHYCRHDTKKQYLDSELNISKMYNLYTNKCLMDENPRTPVKAHLYRSLFNCNFNYGFFRPKNDLCATCEEFKVSTNKQYQYEEHILKKDTMRMERDEDKNKCDKENVVVCFDLENVITLPKTNVGPAFYKRKLNLYNLTAHLSTSNTIYCAIWNETIVGRSGNDIASAFINILQHIVDNNLDILNIVTWSDSCVPQNRNKIMSTAIIGFMLKNPRIKSVTMKYSVPGHSCIQEVDNAHSQIEKHIKKNRYLVTVVICEIFTESQH